MTDQVKSAKEIRIQARVWMLEKGIRSVDIQNALHMKNHILVSDALAGRRNNRRVLRYLLDQGCPVEYLDLPKTMKGNKK